MSEHDEQKALFQWADSMVASGRIPELANLFSIPNGAWTRNVAMAVKLKEEGLRNGVPDIFLAVPVLKRISSWKKLHKKIEAEVNLFYNGLFIEMKFGTNQLTSAQKDWAVRLVFNNYEHCVCYSWVEAVRCIIDYLGLDKTKFAEFYE